jgi:DNA polymerase
MRRENSESISGRPPRATRSAADYLPVKRDLASLRAAAAVCKGCDLYRHATQTVFGEGKRRARILLIGEIPGDREDKAGRPFVGPAGRLLRRALADAGIPENDVYITNAVKHFKWAANGARRFGQPPNPDQIRACRPWLEAELHAIQPRTLACLGATAARAVLGRAVRIKDVRASRHATSFGIEAWITVHPSSLLRAGAVDESAEAFRRFIEDLKRLRPSLTE